MGARMRGALGLSLAVALPLLLPAAASAAPDHTIRLTEESGTETWSGAEAVGLNQDYDSASGTPCPEEPSGPEDYCEQTLLHVDVANPVNVRVTLADDPANDYDLYIYESDPSGARGALVTFSGNPMTLLEEAQIANARGHYLIQVVYYLTTAPGYTATAEITGEGRRRPRVARDVDVPPGLQEFLASDPSLGFTSRSEPHVAQNPLNPDVLVAASKFYNRDPDALAEYEFKVGTYVSFDGGRRWTDLGQLRTCAPSQAPPESWPEENACYPREDPNRDGPEEDGDDVAEEYITSDPWVHFDDEGNAYVMVLDHPPFDTLGEGPGWGMTLHRWESVTPQDVERGDTWSRRIPINFYADDLSRETLGLLDDKNTFAVNNAGPDRDGETGIMIACWGQSLGALIKQQVVCERSTDGGRTWPGAPLPISGVQQLVIGVHVVADRRDPNVFYATWMQYATGGGAGDLGGALTPETLEFAMTVDGGLTWVHRPVPVAPMNGIPRQFPGQRFRNLSIPIMAVGPDGEIYITWAEYVEASDPDNDEDGMEADIVLVKSTDGGITWSDPVRVSNDETAPNPNADQFQPYVAVTESGQVVLSYFDRRLDRQTRRRSGNFFTDVYLARSNDGGATFTEHRLSHDSSNPEHNAPVSGSGLFFGDYQGLVATDCVAIPFVNDTHLANDRLDRGPVRDPDFDRGLPQSQYQEVVAWRVPNTAKFGGPPSSTCPGRD